jgi:nucleoside-diphosphate-sugar epimerase
MFTLPSATSSEMLCGPARLSSMAMAHRSVCTSTSATLPDVAHTSRRGLAGEAYYGVSDQAISIADLAHLVRDLVSPGKPVRIFGKAVHTAECNRYIADISKIGRDLSLRASFSLEQSILDVVEAAQARGYSGGV